MVKDVEWLKPSEIAKRGLIKNSVGKGDYRFIVRLINRGKLPARSHAQATYNGKPRQYWLVSMDDIVKYNKNKLDIT